MKKLKKAEKKDAYTIVLEGLRSDFRVFGEGLSDVRTEVKKHTKILNEHSEILNEHSLILTEHSRMLTEHSQALSELQEDVQVLKADVALIRHNQVTRDEFKFLESRVATLERKATSRAK